MLVSNFCPGFQFGLADFTAAYIAAPVSYTHLAKSKGSEDMKQILIVEDDSFLNKMLAYNLMLSRLVDTFFSRTSWTMLLYAENHSISVA